ncbi:condensin complex subunit 2-like [Nilaparvata lugens]|uniref:condensin complex subunit 2-like n=1 Tax=Nilaparvata lugens TaxID=108931 RepID=UPI00193D36C9|nr:condensin complex subunit 2-like [Nilaparvata lugens]
MFSSDSEDDTFGRVAPQRNKKRPPAQKLGKRRRAGGGEGASSEGDSSDATEIVEESGTLRTPNISTVTPNVSMSGGSMSAHPAFNGSDAAAHSTPELHYRDELKEAKQKKRSFLADTLAQVSSVINDDQEEAWQLAQESHQSTSAVAVADSLHKQQQPYEIAGACFDIKLTSEQLSEHLANCIQLNAANKINKNNAFNLQLIDYMFVLLRRNDKTMQDFPTMSCSLDASTRIYADREWVVACKRQGQEEVDQGWRGRQWGGGGLGWRGGWKREPADAVLASSLDALCRTKIETASWMQRPAIQPEFTTLLRQAAVTLSAQCGLTLLQNDIPLLPPRRQPKQPDRSRVTAVPVDLPPALYDYDFGFSWREEGEEPDGDVIMDFDEQSDLDNDFSFNVHNNTVISAVSHRDSNQEGDELTKMSSSCNGEEVEEVLKEAASKEREAVVSVDDMEGVFGGDDREDSGDEEVQEEVEKEKEKESSKKRHDTLSLVSSKALLAEGDSCYSYIDTDLLPDVWVGPDFWKPKFKRGKPAACQLAPEKAAEKKTRRKTKRTDILSFEDCNNNVDAIFKKKSETAAQTRMIGKWSEKKLTLPGKKNCKMQDVYRSFLRKNLFYKPFLKPDKDAKIEFEYAEDGEHLFNNENNNITDLDGDRVGGIVLNNDSRVSDCDDVDDFNDEPVADIDDVDDDVGGEEPGDEEDNSDVFSADNLVPMPKLVQCDTIKYATVPKRLDMKKLKATIWSMLDLEDDKENRRSRKSSEMKKNTHQTFSDIYQHLPERLMGEMKKDMSPALAFLAILHLTNEKTLDIKSADSTLTDFVIRKA